MCRVWDACWTEPRLRAGSVQFGGMHIDGTELVRIHNLPPCVLDGNTYVIGSVLPVGVLRAHLPANVLIAYLVAGRVRPANAAASRYPHGGMDANIAAVWALGHSPTDFAFNAPAAHQPAAVTAAVSAAVPAAVNTDLDGAAAGDIDYDVEYVVVETAVGEPAADAVPAPATDVASELPVKRGPGRPRKNVQL
jgi:hypothetical protein